MTKKLFALIVFFSFLPKLYSQNPVMVIDSLKKELVNTKGTQKKAELYSELTWYYTNVSIDSSLSYGKKGLHLSKKLKNDKLTGQIYSDLGAVYLTKGDVAAAQKSYTASLKIRQKLKDSAGVAGALSNLGAVYERRSMPDSAMANYVKSLRYFELKNDLNKIDFLKNNIALLHDNMNNYAKAEKMYKEVAAYRKATRQNIQLAMVKVNLGNLYKKQERYAESEKSYSEAAALAMTERDPMVAATAYFNLGFLYNTQEKYKLAIAMFNNSLTLSKGVQSDYDLAKINNGMGMAYYNLEQPLKAKSFYLRALKSMEKMDRRETSRMYLDLIPIYAKLNMPDSADYYLKKFKGNESLILEETVTGQTLELETKYQTEKKERLLLQKETEAKQKNTLIMILAIVAFFLAVVGYLIYHQQKLKNVQQTQEFTLKAAISQIEAQNKLQEQRLEISKDLHDNIGSQLTFIISSVDNINQAYRIENPAISKKLNTIGNFTRETIRELRDTIWAMNNQEITFESLRVRILNFIEKARDAAENMQFSFTVDEELDPITLSSIEGMNLYRVVQEAVNNIIKHSNATLVSVSIFPEPENIKITIRDNGTGFESEIEKGNGLYNMEKRMDNIGGSFALNSLSSGTTIELLMPKKL